MPNLDDSPNQEKTCTCNMTFYYDTILQISACGSSLNSQGLLDHRPQLCGPTRNDEMRPKSA